jgi:hypothetical protein
MTLPQFFQHLKDRDTGTQILDAQSASMKQNYEAIQKANILKMQKMMGGALGGENKGVVISDADNAKGEQIFGRSWVNLTAEEKNKAMNATNEALNYALKKKVLVYKNGELFVNPEADIEDIKDVKAVEEDLLKKNKLKNGIVSTVLSNEEDEKNIKDREPVLQSIEKAKNIAYQKTDNSLPWYKKAAHILAKAHAAESQPALNIAELYGKNKNEEEQRRIKRNKKRIYDNKKGK